MSWQGRHELHAGTCSLEQQTLFDYVKVLKWKLLISLRMPLSPELACVGATHLHAHLAWMFQSWPAWVCFCQPRATHIDRHMGKGLGVQGWIHMMERVGDSRWRTLSRYEQDTMQTWSSWHWPHEQDTLQTKSIMTSHLRDGRLLLWNGVYTFMHRLTTHARKRHRRAWLERHQRSLTFNLFAISSLSFKTKTLVVVGPR